MKPQIVYYISHSSMMNNPYFHQFQPLWYVVEEADEYVINYCETVRGLTLEAREAFRQLKVGEEAEFLSISEDRLFTTEQEAQDYINQNKNKNAQNKKSNKLKTHNS